ncbi:MAG: GTP-binding protein [Phaeodactylibacter sp.]|nr:GTP-binding protein [Phaeodactylibacter sp.]
MISKKIILTGSFGVGKTSLFNKFLYNKFNEKYLTTIGVKVDKKIIEIDQHEVSLLIWDIAGEVTQDKVPHSYFLGASGVIYVFDLTRPNTYENLSIELEYLRTKVPDGVIKVVGNKTDLLDPPLLRDFVEQSGVHYDLLTSAKTGENVEALFHSIGREFVLNSI